MKHANLIDILTKDLHSDDAPRMYCIVINTLTGVVCSQTMRHIGMVRRHEITDEPTLDTRNEQDENSRGQEVQDFLHESNGFSTPMLPMKIAQICDGIRYSLYSEMHAWGEFADESALIMTPVQSITARPNYDQPMSAQMYMQFRIDNAERLNETEIKMAATRLKLAEEVVRAALAEEARRNKAMLIDMTPHVLSEVNSMEDVYDLREFVTLPIETQCAIGEKIASKLDQLYMRLLPGAIRSLEKASKLEAVQRQHAIVKQWLLDNDAELQAAMLLRKAA